MTCHTVGMQTAIATLGPGCVPVLTLLQGGGVQTEGERRLRSTEVARQLGVSRRTVARISADDLPYTLSPGGGTRRQRLYLPADVERFRARQSSDPGETDPALAERVSRLEADVADLKAWREQQDGLGGRAPRA
jgi:uncharacterized protein YceH (UPF0502 family)